MGRTRLEKITVAMMFLLAFAHIGGTAFGEETSVVVKKAKRIKRLVKQGLFPCREVMAVLKTGQTITYLQGDDGDLEKGFDWPEPRFVDHGDGTVTDRVTGLMWIKDTGLFDKKLKWHDAVTECNNFSFAGYDNWRLPNVRELLSLIDYGAHSPALQSDHPFLSVVPTGAYWSSTTSNKHESQAWSVGLVNGSVHRNGKSGNLLYVWPVRRGR